MEGIILSCVCGEEQPDFNCRRYQRLWDDVHLVFGRKTHPKKGFTTTIIRLVRMGRSPAKQPPPILSPERAAPIMRAPLQGLILMHFIAGLRPAPKRAALSGRKTNESWKHSAEHPTLRGCNAVNTGSKHEGERGEIEVPTDEHERLNRDVL